MRRTIDDQKEALIASLAAARSELLTIVLALPAEQRNAPCIGTWCVKDLMAHLVGWDYTNLHAVQEILAGQRPGFLQQYDKDWQSYNAKLVAEYRVEPFEALLAKLHGSHSQLILFLQSLSALEVMKGKSPNSQGRTVTVRNLLIAEAGDERKHAAQLQGFLDGVCLQKVM